MNALIISAILYLIACGVVFRMILNGGLLFGDPDDCSGAGEGERSWPGLLARPAEHTRD